MRALPFLLLAPSLALAAGPVKLAVLPIQPGGTVDARTAALITDRLTSELAKRGDLSVVSTAEMQNLVSFEQQKQLLSCSDNSCLAELGAALGVDFLVSGSVGNLGTKIVVHLAMQDMHSSQVSRVDDEVDGMEQFITLMPYLAGTLTRSIPGGPPVPARPALGASRGGASADGKESGGSSMPRRIAGIVVAGGGGVFLLLGVAAGAASVGYFLASHLLVASLSSSPQRYLGFPIAGLGDVMGILGVMLLVSGVVLAAIP